MKTVMKKLLSIALVAVLLISAVPFQASAATFTVQFGQRGREGADGFTTIKTISGVTTATLASTNFPTNEQADPFGDYRLIGWVIDGTTTSFTKDTKLADVDFNNGGVVYVCAVYQREDYKLNFNTGRSDVPAPASIVITNGWQYGAHNNGALPPLANTESENFLGWVLPNGNMVGATDYVDTTSDITLTAKWSNGTKTVTMQYWNGSDWAGLIAPFTVQTNTAGVVMKHEPFAVASKGEMIMQYVPAGFKITGWVNAATGAAFDPATAVVNEDITIRPVYTGKITMNPNCPNPYNTNPRELEVTIGQKMTGLPTLSSLTNLTKAYVFNGWYIPGTATQVTADTVYYPSIGTEVKAEWLNGVKITLYIYDSNFKLLNDKEIAVYAAEGKQFDLASITTIEGYTKKAGWFTREQFSQYKAGDAATPFEFISAAQLENDNYKSFHAVVAKSSGTGNTGNNSGNNNNNEAADPTNPQTGDMIGVSLALMMSTAGAAVMLGKKRK